MQQNKDLNKVTLEDLMDGMTLRGMLEQLADICYEKAQHLEENWQDETTAKAWTTAGGKLSALASSDFIADVS